MSDAPKSVTKFEWKGDIADDCTCRVGNLAAHCEALDEIRWRSTDEKRTQPGQVWYVSVCHVDDRGFLVGEYLFHSGEPGGLIIGGDMARAIAESILTAHLDGAERGAMNENITFRE